ncbi:hypothetical protein M406DRAFT_74217 [Cryphonectria parasitica EP155]|uniref:Ubiquitin carboxyl-terminal hydrolase n=1 Tax=Cryphonectria parasitica (strain ATCC 38755 / EP155) TaxID=660469 RepID=A0A9P4XZ20_CRYP1|nr:uncharacterized protein M406DRAFT_74217 [Cryphonectria parasitica EP155]KAF3763633.1 hypothetical protein M406DRAFT_74217 [Cryphonectria parasitica EP155]
MPPPAIRRAAQPRNTACRASVKISATADREKSPETLSDHPGGLLGEALTTKTSDDQDKWKAWVEMESEPAFFSGLLRDLGVKDVKVAEMFSVSIDDIQLLPQPVLGFILLCKYANEDQEEAATPAPPPSLWFANQTMANGCATVALLNILMNQPTVDLGASLTAFKAQTADLPPHLRGYLLDSNPAMRQTHNSYARCLEHLNADLLLSNEYEDCGGWPEEETSTTATSTTGGGNKTSAKRKTTTTSNSSAKKKRKSSSAPTASTTTTTATRKKRRRASDDNACHYKAFVPVDGQVWVLDGLEEKPVSLGPTQPPAVANDGVVYDGDAKHDDNDNVSPPPSCPSWVRTALGGIADRMAAAGDDMVSVLAVCESPHPALRRELVANIHAMSAALAAVPDTCTSVRLDQHSSRRLLWVDPDGRIDRDALAEYGLTPEQVISSSNNNSNNNNNSAVAAPTAAEDPDQSGSEGEGGAADVEHYRRRRQNAIEVLRVEQARIRSEYMQVNSEIAGEEELCSGRKRDYGSVVHTWARKIAEKGELQGLMG